MLGGQETKAWLTRSDGSSVLGHGPFRELPSPPKAGVAFYRQDFALRDPAPWKIPEAVEHFGPGEISSVFEPPQPLEILWNCVEATPFSLVFQEVVDSIKNGIFEKTVPVVTETGESSMPVGETVSAWMSRQSAPLHSYGFTGTSSGFAGATPEILFSTDGVDLQTMALAGTARLEDSDVFAIDKKEIREHEFVVTALESKLLGIGKIQKLPREILNLGSIIHFLTRFQVVMESSFSVEDLVRRLHPTPALGPLPRTDETLAALIRWRERLLCPAEFGAPFGLWENGKFDAVVAIRGIWWDDRKVWLPAGCGVIEASRLVNEWRELRLKREAVKSFLRP